MVQIRFTCRSCSSSGGGDGDGRSGSSSSRSSSSSTGLFRVRGNFDTPLNSVVDGPILKSFEVGIANTG